MTEVHKRAQILMGKAHLNLGQYNEARCAFQVGGSKEGLVACGKAALEAGDFANGRMANSAAMVEMPKDELVACGTKAFQSGKLSDAIRACYAAKVPMPVEGLIICGAKALEAGDCDTARKAFLFAAEIELAQPTP